MAERSGFFNSINKDRVYDSSDIARFLKKFFTNGIFNNSLKVTANDNMTVTIETGTANINGYSYELDEAKTIDIADADTTLSRIDSIILRLDLTNRQITSQIIQGDTATNPSQPSITRSGTVYDLRLANISIPTGTTRITNDMITDTRFSSECGNVTQAVLSLDTNDIFNQYQTAWNAWFANIQSQLSGDVAGNLQNAINDSNNNISNIRTALGLSTDTYSSTSTYALGDLVVYNNMIYECTTAITSAETWNQEHWTLVPIIVN